MPFQLVITMSHSENNGKHHVWERQVQLQLWKGQEEGEYTQGTVPLLANAAFPVSCMVLPYPQLCAGSYSAGSRAAGTLLAHALRGSF